MKAEVSTSLTAGELVKRYRVGFQLQPRMASVIQGQITQLICHLELSGNHGGLAIRCDARCLACIQVQRALLFVVETLRRIAREMSERSGGIYTAHLHYASTAESGHKVRLGIEMTLRQPITGTPGGSMWIFLQGLRAELSELGCRNCSLAGSVRGKSILKSR